MKYFNSLNYMVFSFTYSSIRKLYYTYDIKYKKIIEEKNRRNTDIIYS
jgi:hypothetical protein